jgi:hypothetical protein
MFLCCFPVKPKSNATSQFSLDRELEAIAFAHDNMEAMSRENSDLRFMVRNIKNHLIKTIAKNRSLEARVAGLERAMKMQDLDTDTNSDDTRCDMSG